MPRILAHHQVIDTTDLDEARAEVASKFCDHLLEPIGRDARLNMAYHSAPIGDAVSLNYLRYGTDVRITPGRFDDFYLVQIPVAGTARVQVGQRTVHSSRHRASVGSPTEAVDMRWSADCEQILIYMRRDSLQQLASGPEPVVFSPAMDLADSAIQSWVRLVKLGLDDLNGGGMLFRSPTAAASFEDTLMSALLASQPHLGDKSAVPQAHARHVRRAIDLIEATPEYPWRVAELAAQSGVSARTLQDAFHRELGMSPLQRLQRTRLERVREELLLAEPGTISVTDAATRWGFFNLGRFARAYHQRYAELPSHTLTRSVR